MKSVRNNMSLNFGYETEEYYREDRDPVDPDDFNRALEEQNRKSGNRDWTVSVFCLQKTMDTDRCCVIFILI